MTRLLRRFLAALLDPEAAELAERALHARVLLESAGLPNTVRIYHGDGVVQEQDAGWRTYDPERVDAARRVLGGGE